MSLTVEALAAEALRLSAAERAQLVERLIASLDVDPDVEEAWAAEVERRHAEIENGSVPLLPGAETLTKLRAAFIAAAAADDRPASQVVRELMRDYIARQRQAHEYDGYLRRKVEIARGSVRAGRGRSNDAVEANKSRLVDKAKN